MGIFRPIELTDVYSLDVYIGIQLPKEIDILLNEEEVNIKKDDYLVFDFNGNISYIKQENFSSFYRKTKLAPFQQLLSAIQLFKIESNPDEVFIKSEYNESMKGSEDAIFGKLAEMIMNGKVDKQYLELYKGIIDEKYKNELINYTVLSDYKAQYISKKLKEKKIKHSLISPLLDSIVEYSEDGDFDVDATLAESEFLAVIVTIESTISSLMGCIQEMNQDLLGQAHSLDTLSLSELLDFKAQFDSMGMSVPGINVESIVEQMKQEAMEQIQMYGSDELALDNEDIFR